MATPRPGQTNAIAMVIITFFIMVLMAGIALASILEAHALRRQALHADGVVFATPFGGSHPRIRFTTEAGQVIEFNQNGFIGGYQTGAKVRVLYRAEDPQATAVLDNLFALMGFGGFALCAAVMAAFAFGVALIMLQFGASFPS